MKTDLDKNKLAVIEQLRNRGIDVSSKAQEDALVSLSDYLDDRVEKKDSIIKHLVRIYNLVTTTHVNENISEIAFNQRLDLLLRTIS